MPSRDVQEAREKIYQRLREAGERPDFARRHTHAAAEQVARSIDEGRVKPPGKG